MKAYVWSTGRVRESVDIDLSSASQAPTNERNGSDNERIVDFGLHVGLIIATHYGWTPFGQELSKRDGYSVSECVGDILRATVSRSLLGHGVVLH